MSLEELVDVLDTLVTTEMARSVVGVIESVISAIFISTIIMMMITTRFVFPPLSPLPRFV